MTQTPEYVDVLVVGAGLSGVGAACHLQKEAPKLTFAIVEARAVSGGTWDLFRYPNVRSDSDMYTLGYEFEPWLDKKSIADGDSILRYIRETAAKYGVEEKIQYSTKVTTASWHSGEAKWTVGLVDSETGAERTIKCNFLWGNTGYYRYDEGFRPHFENEESFTGQIVHPQFWPEDLAIDGKRIVVIGSGATAMTLVPALAQTAGHVTMLQRSPTYVAARPDVDGFANFLQSKLPAKMAFRLIRWKNVALSTLAFQLSRRRPEVIKKALRQGAIDALPEGFDVDTHFSPAYNPWDQRLCLVPNGDLFAAISAGTVDVVTEHIERFTANGIVLKSGVEIPADIIVTATGLSVQMLGGMTIDLDGTPLDISTTVAYKGIMLTGVPNLAMTFGYTNASWTLKADLTARYICRLLNEMRRQKKRTCTPEFPSSGTSDIPYIELASGYIARAANQLPKQGTKMPWRLYQNYFLDTALFRLRRVNDHMKLS